VGKSNEKPGNVVAVVPAATYHKHKQGKRVSDGPALKGYPPRVLYRSLNPGSGFVSGCNHRARAISVG
jgi:hypothetical protein